MGTVGVGLIGCGGRLNGVAHGVCQASPEIEIRALYDPSADAIAGARQLFRTDATVYDSAEALVRDPAIDWVMIGSWNCAHAAQTVAAFDAGKHVFCEKPLATTLPDCLAMYDAWQRSGKMFTIGFTLRYSPHYLRIKALLEQGIIGELVSMEFNETLSFGHGGFIHADWRRFTANAGTHLLEKCCHDVDLVNWFVGSRARRVASFGGCDFFIPANARHMDRLGTDPEGGRRAYCHLWRVQDVDPFTADKDIVDNQVAIIEFENNVRATFHTNCNAGIPERRMYLLGTEGALRADVIAGTIEVQRIGFGTRCENISTDASGGHGGGDDILCRGIAESMLRGAPSHTSLTDGLDSAVTCFGIDDALATGAVVEMAPYWARVDAVVRRPVAG
ncbi:MAG TPA: Gfo/Idh/MocA family oxidoreductase [Armatimonadota bacterium]|nr:Gfo/Idh/MocA family oxidoreductase [Armatimonadota bacterium]